MDLFTSDQLKAFNHQRIPNLEAFESLGFPLVSCTRVEPNEEVKDLTEEETKECWYKEPDLKTKNGLADRGSIFKTYSLPVTKKAHG